MAANIYQLKIALAGAPKPVWRVVEVSSDTSFYLLHCIIQGAMGWENGHLHQFITKDRRFLGIPSSEDFFEVEDARKIKLSDELLAEKDTIIYEYDFGDSWEHKVTLQKVLAPAAGVAYPQLVKGKNACPPEDCGGVWGYAELLETLQNPDSKDYGHMCEWLGIESGSDLDPTYFDIEKQTKEMHTMYARGKKLKGKEFF
ncbi:MAG TPA: plasmid pRiA4b ORF-3 family protein [Saprospiraceae bacterium]|nr:plasmid pRiA4b ORF-3 family protein [Saprospiraceae bacterium]HMP23097.1 plasmid pRiA4b ORF-3 family protein [Saprospiraceae bacterium]